MLLLLASLLLAVAAESPSSRQGYDDTKYGSEYPGGSGSSGKDKGTLENLGLIDFEVADQSNGKGWQDVAPGTPEKDYPNFDRVPETSFTCQGKIAGGYYADVETRCQVFHVCNTGGVKSSFLCPGGSIFNQKYFVCDWWYDFECDDALELYHLNGRNNRGNEGGHSESALPESDYSSKEGDQVPSVSYNGGSNILKDGFDLSLAGTGEGASGYTGNKESHGYQSNVKNIGPNESRPSGNYKDRKTDPGQQRISNDFGQDVGSIEERWKNRDRTNENRESHENHSVQRDYDRSMYHSRRKDQSLKGYEEIPSVRRIFSSQDNRNSRPDDDPGRDHFDLNEERRNFEKGKYLTLGNEGSSFNERSEGDTNFDKGYDKNNRDSNRFSNIQESHDSRSRVRNHYRNDHFFNGSRSQGENDPDNERAGITSFSEKFDKSYQQNNHYPIPAQGSKTSDERSIIDNENHFGERSSRPGITYLYPNENDDKYEINDFLENNHSDKNVNHSLESSRDYRKKQFEPRNNVSSELRQDSLTPDKSRRKDAGRTVQRSTGGLQGGIGNGYPGPNRELPGSNAIAGTIPPVLPVESQDLPNDRAKGTGSLNFNGHYPRNEYPSGPPRQETGSPGFGLNANNGYPGIRPNPNTNGILTGQGRTSLATRTPSGTTSPGEITSISTGYGNGVAGTTDNFNERNTGDYKGGLQRDETHSTRNVPTFGKRNRIQNNQGYLPPESGRDVEDNKKFVKNIKSAENNFEKFDCRKDRDKKFDYLPPEVSRDERDGRRMADRTRYLPAL